MYNRVKVEVCYLLLGLCSAIFATLLIVEIAAIQGIQLSGSVLLTGCLLIWGIYWLMLRMVGLATGL